MQISVTFRHIEPSEALKNYVTDRLQKFKRYLDGPVDAHVVFKVWGFKDLGPQGFERRLLKTDAARFCALLSRQQLA